MTFIVSIVNKVILKTLSACGRYIAWHFCDDDELSELRKPLNADFDLVIQRRGDGNTTMGATMSEQRRAMN